MQGGQGGEVHWFPLLGSLKNNWSDLAGDEGGPESSVGATKGALGPLKAWGGGPWRAGKGGYGGGGGPPESSVGATKGAGSLKNLTTV